MFKNPQYDFPKMRGGGQRPFGTFPKSHPFWEGEASLREVFKNQNGKFTVKSGDTEIRLGLHKIKIMVMGHTA